MRIKRSWSEFKDLIEVKNLPIQYKVDGLQYFIWVNESNDTYYCNINIESGNTDQADFENNYKTNANQPIAPHSLDGKEIVRSESKPLNYTTVFLTRSDSVTDIGDGKELIWDFSNSDDEISMPSGSGMKRKRLEFAFLDSIYLKEGTIYYHNVLKNSYIDFYVVCPDGAYYYDNDSNLQQAVGDTPISHYIVRHPIQGSVPMGDELNTETCSNEIPNYYKFRVEITVPDSDTTSNGSVSLEIYRKRTVIL